MQIVPRGQWIVGKPVDVAETIPGSKLVLTDGERSRLKERPIMEVLAVGPDAQFDPETEKALLPSEVLKAGQIVAYDRNERIVLAGQDGKLYIMVKAEHVTGVITSDERASAEEIERLRREAAEEQARAQGERAAARAAPRLVTPEG